MRINAPSVLAACIVFVLAAGTVSAQTTARSSQGTSATIEQQVRTAHQQLLEAARSHDQEAARSLMAEGATWVSGDGKVSSAAEMLGGSMKPPEDVSIERVQPFGDIVIVSGSAQFEDGRQVRFLQEWVNRDGGWRLFAHQGTAVAPADAPSQPATVGTSGMSTMRGTTPTFGSAEDRAVWKAQTDLHRAFLSGNSAAYSRLTADNFIRVAAGGERQNKSEFLQTVKQNAKQSPGLIETDDVQLAVTGDTARLVMTTWGTLPGGQPIPPARVTRIFVKRSGQWQQAAAIFTPVAQQ